MKKSKANPPRPLSERTALAQQVNQYRAEHPELSLPQVLTAMALPGVTESNYYAWEARRKLEEKANPTESFPLSAIPERPKPVISKPKPVPQSNDLKLLAASLLDIAASLLRR